MKKGSITIFSVLTMMLVASVLFALLEGTRFQEITRISNLQTEVALEAAFANYNSVLWEEYQLLGCDVNSLEESLVIVGNARKQVSQGDINLLLSEVDKVSLQGYTRLTDDRGRAYIYAVSNSMQKTYFVDAAKQIFNQYEVIKDIKENSSWDISRIAEGLSCGEAENYIIEDNPMQEVQQMQSRGILELVVEDETSISSAFLQKGNVVSQRVLNESKNSVIYECNWIDRIMFQQYLLQNMSSYCNKMSERCLEYELEYIIGGASSDIENLKKVVAQLLIIREMANFLYLTTDAQKVEEAQILAFTLAGISANPLVVETVKIGILTAWAFGESILDVRALLQGKKVPLLKSAETWTLELSEVAHLSEKFVTAKESQWGLTYQDYLGILILFQQENDLAMHAMDVQEAAIRLQEKNSDFQMDNLIIQAEAEIDYNYHPIFLSFYQLEAKLPGIYKIKTSKTYSYY